MHLKTIRISGFKSFVEPTKIVLPDMFCCIVGPNGCGKSNIVDAVRWVIGESSSRQMRSESMADVIFNGTAGRSALSQASVELLLDNSDGSLGGMWAKYAEILVRREVNREGESHYFINGIRCRRRDVVDIFLGTGLGPHSYAIIGQGMIARLIDAHPEDLRTLLEEAAGVSRYRERRREAERRMHHTRQNMERLDDVRNGLVMRLKYLQQQSRATLRYTRYRDRERRVSAELLALQMRSCVLRREILQSEERKEQNRVEKIMASLRGQETALEAIRQRLHSENEELRLAQAKLYEISADAVRLEEAMRGRKERTQQLREERKAADVDVTEMEEHIATDRARLGDWDAQIKDLGEKCAQLEERRQTAEQVLAEHEEQGRKFAARRDALREKCLQSAHQLEQCRARCAMIEEEMAQLAVQAVAPVPDVSMPQTPQSALQAALEQCRECADIVAAAEALGKQKSSAYSAAAEQLRIGQAHFEQSCGRSEALQALQRSSAEESALLRGWMEKLPLENAEPLSEVLEIEPGWETAAEMVLAGRSALWATEDLPRLIAELRVPAPVPVEFLQRSHAELPTEQKWTPLSTYVRAPFSLLPLLNGIYAVADLDSALEIMPELMPGNSVIVPEGIWLAPGSLRVAGAETGGLHLQAALENSVRKQRSAQQQLANLRRVYERSQKSLRKAEEQCAKRHKELVDAERERSILNERAERWREAQQQREQMEKMLSRNQSRHAQLLKELTELQKAEQKTGNILRTRETEQANLQGEEKILRKQREAAHTTSVQTAEALHQARLDSAELVARRQEAEVRVRHFVRQIELLRERSADLDGSLRDSDAPLSKMQRERDAHNKSRAAAEKDVEKLRAALMASEKEQRVGQGSRAQYVGEIETLRELVQEKRLQLAAVDNEYKAAEEKITGLGFSAQTVFAELPDELCAEDLHSEKERLQSRIERVGPVNLVAAEEYQSESERKEHMDRQYLELEQTLQLLERSIRDIDLQTQRLFRESFDRVNSGLQEVFPRLFGGGHAQIVMEEERRRDSGVHMVARPPGKRNTSIRQLSGGEQTLAAIALVLAIFRLNPAPFCIFDEVDAPLDDANILRFVELMSELSKQLQVVCVTHNKITMEAAQNLLGVTMAEPGVSRVVSVDLEAAERMAERSVSA